jgi:2-polyprenyl-3-methyl-5-hydroxy-6-metoxy-1,4-benzoquinol methylase
MPDIVDERGYNQIFKPTTASAIRLRRRAQAMVTAMDLPATPEARASIRILEIGCGMGELAHELALLTGARVTGVDLSPGFIEHARTTYRHPQLEFIVADLSQSTPASAQEQYDFIVGNGILHHLYHHLHTFLPVLARWLAPTGRLIFWEPNLWNPYVYLIFTFPFLRRAAKLEPDEMAFTTGFIRRKLVAAGFGQVRAVTRDFLLPNTPAVLVRPVIAASNLLDRIPFVNLLAQSLFFVAVKSPASRG